MRVGGISRQLYLFQLAVLAGLAFSTTCSAPVPQPVTFATPAPTRTPIQLLIPVTASKHAGSGQIEIPTAQPTQDQISTPTLAITQTALIPTRDAIQVGIINLAIQDLSARLQTPISKIAVESVEPVVWSDSCLGLRAADWELATFQSLTPTWRCAAGSFSGLRVVFSRMGEKYVYHIDYEGYIRPKYTFAMTMAEPVWVEITQTDGLKGKCDVIKIYADRVFWQNLCENTVKPTFFLTKKLAQNLYRISLSSGPFVENMDKDLSVAFYGVGFDKNALDARALIHDLVEWILEPVDTRQCTYRNQAHNYLFQYPCYWMIEEGDTGKTVLFYTPAHRVSRTISLDQVEISYISDVQDESVSNLAQVYIDMQSTGGFSPLSTAETVIANQPGVRLNYIVASGAETVVYLVVIDGSFYTIKGSGDIGSVDKAIRTLAFPGRAVPGDGRR